MLFNCIYIPVIMILCFIIYVLNFELQEIVNFISKICFFVLKLLSSTAYILVKVYIVYLSRCVFSSIEGALCVLSEYVSAIEISLKMTDT